ncbi:hypothetical protein [Thermococcus sp. 9N3]|uniref:hypothetical protein n=1 Tax=Thermococcus sp. 9N3 TaxID=163002 RepID=UPI00143121FF|nr:hypothetical protein [Thermococcus sp. 9N3]
MVSMKRYAVPFALILFLCLGVFFYAQDTDVSSSDSCFSRVMVNVSDVKPPIVSGPGFPPWAGFKGITLDEVVNGSPRHVLIGFFGFENASWPLEKPSCYFKSLEGVSKNWTGIMGPGLNVERVKLSGTLHMALYVYPLEGTAIIAKVDYGDTPEKSKITEAFRLDYEKNPSEIVDAYISKLEHSGHTAVRELSGGLSKGWVFKKGGDYLLVIETRDAGNLYLILAWGGEDDVKKLADSISRVEVG